MKKIITIVLPVLALALAGCGGSDGPATAAGGRPVPAPAVHAGTPTAERVVSALRAAGAPIAGMTAFTAESDPRKLLGRPGGYLSKVAFADSRIPASEVDPSVLPDAVDRGGVVEVFADAAGAAARVKLMQGILQGAGGVLGTEYDYTAGPVLVRVTGKLTPTQAMEYERALKTGATG